MDENHGWFTRTSGGDWSPDPTDDQRALLDAAAARRKADRGRRLAVVQVVMFEHGECVPQVSLPPGCALGIDAGAEAIGAVVRRARRALEDWR